MSLGAKPGQFCATPQTTGGNPSDRPLVQGYNYTSIVLANHQTAVANAAYPQAIVDVVYEFTTYVTIAGFWLSSSIMNDGSPAGVFVTRVSENTIAVPNSSNIMFHHVSLSDAVVTRSSGMGFNGNSGFLFGPGEKIGIYLMGAAAGATQFFYTLDVYWIVR